MSELQVLHLTTKLISLACLLQAIELLQLKSIWSKNTIWDWDTLKNNFSKIYQIILSPVLKDSGYYSLLVLTVLLSILGILTNNYYILPVLLVTSYLSSMRWGGSFNGGSDYMTILVLLTSTSAFLLPQYSHYIWIYLGVQVVLSYFISGV
ncbi:MAG: hypothetical protein KDD37_06330, partial [Bdellovibrionales bacterium]|nr:hypothetical protein [Bdellovibrionales bacterium]